MEQSYSIGEFSRVTDISAHTLRYYERIGLMEPIARAAGGRRRYSESDRGFVEFLTLLRATGMPIRGMLAFVRLVREGDATFGARAEVLERHREVVRQRMAKLALCKSVLDHKIDFYRGRREQAQEEACRPTPLERPTNGRAGFNRKDPS